MKEAKIVFKYKKYIIIRSNCYWWIWKSFNLILMSDNATEIKNKINELINKEADRETGK